MDSLLFLGLVALVVIFFALRQTKQVRAALEKHTKSFSAVPKTVSVLILIAQVSELIKMLDHVSVVNVVGSLLLLAIMNAAKSASAEATADASGTEGQWN